MGPGMKLILAPPSSDDLIHLLKAWRFWLLGALVGALLGLAIYFVAPPPYRARATVDVDFHLEQAWPQNTDREQFYYLERETRKLQDIAFSDAVLNAVAARVHGATLEELRGGELRLSQPGNGGWHFYADDRDPRRAADLASAWAQAFVETVKAEVAKPSSGLEQYITVLPAQTQNPPAQRRASMSTYMLVGAMTFLAASALFVLFLDFGE